MSVPKHFSTAPLPLALIATAVFLFVGTGPPGFRDGAHFYGPLFQYVFEELGAGRLPLWNPYENLGQPLAANPTTMLFYPGTWIAFLSYRCGAEAQTAYFGFMAGHLLLAVLTTYRLARNWRCSREAATLAGICYALGGTVLFQWNNAPFLVGAAWLPEALRFAGRTIRRPSIGGAVGLAVVSALMILGGDPQAAYHAAICTTILFVLSKHFSLRRGFFAARTLGFLLLAVPLTLLIAAVQILPAVELTLLSDRMLPEHRSSVGHFSVPPRRLLEFFQPDAGGRLFPVHARRFSAMPSDREVWAPSLYMGLLPVLLCLSSISPVLKQIKNRSDVKTLPSIRPMLNGFGPAAWIVLLIFLLGSLGSWFVVYPLFQGLPGYILFRFPAKLSTVAALMIALLGAAGFDRLLRDGPFFRNFRLALRIVVAVSSAIALVGLAMIPGGIPACPLFGPFQETATRAGTLRTLANILLFYLLFEAATRETSRSNATGYALLAIVFLDLLLANAWLPVSIPRNEPTRRSPLLAAMTGARPDGDSAAPIRLYRFPVWYPPEFQTLSSKYRLAEARHWERDSLFPRYTLPLRVDVVDVRGTLMPADYRAVTDRIRSALQTDEPGESERQLEELGVQYVVAPEGKRLDAEPVEPTPGWPDGVRLWKLRDPLGRDYRLFEPNRLVFDRSLSKPETVAIPEQYWPGWRAFVDRRELAVERVDGVFRGVRLPAGRHRVLLVYDPPLVRYGAVLSVIGVALSMIGLFAGRHRETSKRKTNAA